jgi:hypothetical protein
MFRMLWALKIAKRTHQIVYKHEKDGSVRWQVCLVYVVFCKGFTSFFRQQMALHQTRLQSAQTENGV